MSDFSLLLGACVAYVVCSTSEIELQGSRPGNPGRVFGGIVLYFGIGVGIKTVVISTALVLAFELALRFALKRRPREILKSLILYVVSGLLLWGMLERLPSNATESVAGLMIGTACIAMGIDSARFISVVGRGVLADVRKYLRHDVLLYLVLGSVAALAILTSPQLGPGGLVVGVAFFYMIKLEFKRFAEAKITYAQTVGALGRLVERAGFVPLGHHKRLTFLSNEIAAALGFGYESIERLQLFSRISGVGLISLGDPEDTVGAPSLEILEHTRRFLSRTGYLGEASPPGFAEGSDAWRSLDSHVVEIAWDRLMQEHTPVEEFAAEWLKRHVGNEANMVAGALIRVSASG